MTPAYYTHSDYLAFLAGIRAAPADDLPRLVLADWLDENGWPERAELIRKWVAGLAEFSTERWPFDPPATWSESPFAFLVEMDRGFVSLAQFTFADWCRHAPLILPESVGLTVRLTNRPTFEGGTTELPPWLRGDPERVRVGWGESRDVAANVRRALTVRWPDVAFWEVPEQFADNLAEFQDGIIRMFGLPPALAGVHSQMSYSAYHADLQQFRDRFGISPPTDPR